MERKSGTLLYNNCSYTIHATLQCHKNEDTPRKTNRKQATNFRTVRCGRMQIPHIYELQQNPFDMLFTSTSQHVRQHHETCSTACFSRDATSENGVESSPPKLNSVQMFFFTGRFSTGDFGDVFGGKLTFHYLGKSSCDLPHFPKLRPSPFTDMSTFQTFLCFSDNCIVNLQ